MASLRICISAPGKVILHGEHSVVYDKLALAASLGLRTRLEFCEFEEGEGGEVEFCDLGISHCYNFKDIHQLLATPIPLTKPPAYYNLSHPEFLSHEEVVKIIETFVSVKFQEPKQRQALISFFYLFWTILGSTDSVLKRFKLTLRSDLTVGAGTGSSASFAVTIAAFLLQFIKIKKFESKFFYKTITELNLENLNGFDQVELDLVSKWAFQSERIIHGTPSGVDNTICTFGGLVSFRKSTTPHLIQLSSKLTLILINTNTPRDTKHLVGKVASKRVKYRPIIDAILDAMDQTTIKALDYLQKIDNSDVLELYEALGELVDVNQNLLRCLGVSHPRLDEACETLAEFGLHGKLTGAGGGGCAICVVPPYGQERVDEVIAELKKKGFGAVFTDLGGYGVRVDQ
ncbi:mevalonate kinase [Tribolium madens]|uniref:mevalonate kinase n=1 Tax=Tribolium madens TaxID=41895 RepID=UPI001CF75297|nr:mevalonate kinase [Tribolium madens]